MTSFASVAELRSLLELPALGDGEQDPRAELVLEVASDVIRAEVGQVLSEVADDEAVLDVYGSQVAVLPEFPVTAVSAVSIDGADSVADVTWARSGLLDLGTATSSRRRVVVTYTHGFAVVPADIKGVCLAAAVRSYENPTGERSETVGSIAASHGGAPVVLTEDEKRALDPYRV